MAALKHEDLAAAEVMLIAAIQRRSFSEEIDELLEKGKRSCGVRGNAALKNKSLRHHNPFIGDGGLMRIGSRLVNADIDDEAKFPAVLPPGDKNVCSLIFHVHARNTHAGPKHSLNVI